MNLPNQKCQAKANFMQNCLFHFKWPIIVVSSQGKIQIVYKKRLKTSTTGM